MKNQEFERCLRELGPVLCDFSARYTSEVFLAALALHFGNGLKVLRDLSDTSQACNLLRITRRRAGLSWWMVR